MWNTSDKIKLDKLSKAVACIACQIKNGGGGEETDPIFKASPAATITVEDIQKWNTSYVETDPIFKASPAYGITLQDIEKWNLGGETPNLQQVTDKGNTTNNGIESNSYISGTQSVIKGVNGRGTINSNFLMSNRNYELPDKSGTIALLDDIKPETDPIFTSSPSYSITQADITRWNEGGSGGGDYVPMAGMNVAGGEYMKEGFAVSNFNFVNETPPNSYLTFSIDRGLGGFIFQAGEKSAPNETTSSISASSTNINFSNSTANEYGAYSSSNTLGGANSSSVLFGNAADGTFNSSTQIMFGSNVIGKDSSMRLSNQGSDFNTGEEYYSEFRIDRKGYNFVNLYAANNDPAYTRKLVSTVDGYLAWQDNQDTSKMATRSVVNGAVNSNIPELILPVSDSFEVVLQYKNASDSRALFRVPVSSPLGQTDEIMLDFRRASIFGGSGVETSTYDGMMLSKATGETIFDTTMYDDSNEVPKMLIRITNNFDGTIKVFHVSYFVSGNGERATMWCEPIFSEGIPS